MKERQKKGRKERKVRTPIIVYAHPFVPSLLLHPPTASAAGALAVVAGPRPQPGAAAAAAHAARRHRRPRGRQQTQRRHNEEGPPRPCQPAGHGAPGRRGPATDEHEEGECDMKSIQPGEMRYKEAGCHDAGQHNTGRHHHPNLQPSKMSFLVLLDSFLFFFSFFLGFPRSSPVREPPAGAGGVQGRARHRAGLQQGAGMACAPRGVLRSRNTAVGRVVVCRGLRCFEAMAGWVMAACMLNAW